MLHPPYIKSISMSYLLLEPASKRANVSTFISNNCHHMLLQFSNLADETTITLLPNTSLTILSAFKDNCLVFSQAGYIPKSTCQISIPAHDKLYIVQIPAAATIQSTMAPKLRLARGLVVDTVSLISNFEEMFSAAPTINMDRLSYAIEHYLFAPHLSVFSWHTSLVNNMLSYMSMHRFTIKISDVATYLGYSERQTYQIFKDTFGVSLKTYCLLERFGFALTLLSSFSPSISEVALTLGYYDQAHFNHAFKRISGITPMDYLNKYLALV